MKHTHNGKNYKRVYAHTTDELEVGQLRYNQQTWAVIATYNCELRLSRGCAQEGTNPNSIYSQGFDFCPDQVELVDENGQSHNLETFPEAVRIEAMLIATEPPQDVEDRIELYLEKVG